MSSQVIYPSPNLDEIRRAFSILCESGAVYELRTIDRDGDGRDQILSGYYDDMDAMCNDALRLSRDLERNVYFTLQPVKPELLARRANRMVNRPKETTRENNTLRYRLVALDVDPNRESGICATQREKASAGEVTRATYQFLRGRGWAEPLIATSGNGFYLFYRIDLPNDAPSRQLLANVLKALSFLHDTDKAHIDATMDDPCQIIRVLGTVNRKGDDVPERPHRLAHIIGAPPQLTTISVSQLQELASLAPIPAEVPKGRPEQRNNRAFDLGSWLTDHSYSFRTARWNNATKYILNHCPFNPQHRGSSVVALQFDSGAVGFCCKHNSCKDKSWADFRALHHERVQSRDVGCIDNNLYKATSLSAVEDKQLHWLCEKHIPFGMVSEIVGEPDIGKTTVSIDLAARVTRGDFMPDGSKGGGPANVLLLTSEDHLSYDVKPLAMAAGAILERIFNVDVIKGDNSLFSFYNPPDIEFIKEYIIENAIRFVVISPLISFMGARTDIYKESDVRRALIPLRKLAEELDIAILSIRHPPKEVHNPKYYASGSVAMTNLSRASFFVAVDEEEDPPVRLFGFIKGNKLSDEDKKKTMGFRLIQSDVNECAKVEWLRGYFSKTAKDVLVTHRLKTEKERAIQFLKQELKEVPKLVDDLKDAAEANGINWNTVEASAKSAGVISGRRREPNKPQKECRYQWWLESTRFHPAASELKDNTLMTFADTGVELNVLQ